MPDYKLKEYDMSQGRTTFKVNDTIIVNLPSNANGNRMMVVSNEAASGAAINNAFRDYKAPAPGATTTTQCTGFIIVPYMEERTIYVNGKQNSGSSLTASCRIHAVRLK